MELVHLEEVVEVVVKVLLKLLELLVKDLQEVEEK
jgi:hypothetical protein